MSFSSATRRVRHCGYRPAIACLCNIYRRKQDDPGSMAGMTTMSGGCYNCSYSD